MGASWSEARRPVFYTWVPDATADDLRRPEVSELRSSSSRLRMRLRSSIVVMLLFRSAAHGVHILGRGTLHSDVLGF